MMINDTYLIPILMNERWNSVSQKMCQQSKYITSKKLLGSKKDEIQL